MYLFLCFFFSFLSKQRNTHNRTHNKVRYNKLSTNAEIVNKNQHRRKHRTTTLAIPADDCSNLIPSEADSDDNDEHADILSNETNTDQISLHANT